MKQMEIFEPALFCSSGLCGSEVNQNCCGSSGLLENKKYPVFFKKNIPSYLAVMLVWLFLSLCSGLISGNLIFKKRELRIPSIVLAGINIMLGMSIMFFASLLNLKKLLPGFKKMAEGDTNPDIPSVWCPVLTMATNAAIELTQNKKNKEIKK